MVRNVGYQYFIIRIANHFIICLLFCFIYPKASITLFNLGLFPGFLWTQLMIKLLKSKEYPQDCICSIMKMKNSSLIFNYCKL